MTPTNTRKKGYTELKLDADAIRRDYRIAVESRQMSLLGRREVMAGKAKFGIFGDGKEVPQLALARAFRPGDFRSGYYRDQTLMLALEATTLDELFAQLYALPDIAHEPATGGRAMNAHFATRSLNPDGSWKPLTDMVNTASDISPTGSQMPRLVGLAYASRLYRELEGLRGLTRFSRNGEEVAFGTIGNASCAEGMFWESLNAIGVLQVPAIISIWDDEYGISVPNEHQITKTSLSDLLEGFRRTDDGERGFDIYTVRGWNYPELVAAYAAAADRARTEHIPAVVHVVELTQPQGHSTSGSHERYKSTDRLEWEQAHDCVVRMRKWMIDEGIADEKALDAMEAEARAVVEERRDVVWERFLDPIRREAGEAAGLIGALAGESAARGELEHIRDELIRKPAPGRRDIMVAVRRALIAARGDDVPARRRLVEWKTAFDAANEERYGSYLHSRSAESPLDIPEVPARYGNNPEKIQGYDILNANFDAALERDPRVVAFGEDVGQLGDVNQGFRGLQEKHGFLRVADTGIREVTILGQAIGMAMRGLRPIAEIQYLDYVLYALQLMSDDLATLLWRTRGGQKAPVIVRTRGHRLEGIWHSGSPMAGIIHLVRGMHVLVPRNMVQAAGFYNTLLRGDDPGLVVEVLNAYRIREAVPENLSDVTVPLGVPEVMRAGDDVTVVTYGACCAIAMEAAAQLETLGISTEVIDARSLLPFDREGMIGQSLRRTNRIVFLDEDVPGGTTAYMMQEVLERQGGYRWLDSEPRTITARAHRPAYGSDGDYWSKPGVESVIEGVYALMHEAVPGRYPRLFG